MSAPGWSFGLPLLTKDLIEQAAHRRTYILRVVYAAVLYGAALWIYADISGGGSQAEVLSRGQGRQMFLTLVAVQLWAAIILLPAISSGAITSEKERDTLGLLLLTQLSPTTIILEKLISRMVTMGTYQLLSLPLFAVVYGLGGVELFEILAAIWYLAWWSLVIGAISIGCSAWHRTTAGAFISAYAIMPLVVCFAMSCQSVLSPAVAEIWRPSGEMSTMQYFVASLGTIVLLLAMSVPLLLVTWFVVAFAQMHLLQRAFVPPRNLLLEFFKGLDKFFEDLNNQTTSGILLVRDIDTGPLFDPIAWRETRKRSLGTVRYLFRLLIVLEVPLAIAISWTVTDNGSSSFDGPTTFFLTLLWPISVLAIVVHTTNVIFAEHSRQTLDVLLVTPLTARELVTQKLAGVRRLIAVLSVPFLTLVIFQATWTLYVVRGLGLFGRGSDDGNVFVHEILGMTLALLVYPRVVQWLSFHHAIRVRNHTQAVLWSLITIIGLCGIPYLVVYLVGVVFSIEPTDATLAWITWLSPIRVLFHRKIVQPSPWSGANLNQVLQDRLFVGLALNAVTWVGLWLFLRYRAMRDFSSSMGRAEPSGAES